MRKLLSVLCLTVVLIQGVLMPANGQESDAAGKIWFEGAGDVQDVRTGGNQSGQAEAASQVNLSGQSGSQEQTEAESRKETGDQSGGAGQTDRAGQTDSGGREDGTDQAAAAGQAGSGGQTKDATQTAPAGQADKTGQAESPAQVDLGVTAESAVLMEASTGTIIFEKNCDKQLRPASITKIMTLILIFDALDAGKISLDDEVTTSAYAKSMGGSQVFLEEGEKQTVETLIKCIVVASGNDASVTMAEHLAGSEAEFVKMMNARAASLNMTNTHFEDCCGLTESAIHLTSARDVAIMSRELITKYPQISQYSTIWMENITHVTKQGTTEFGLANTNKLLKMSNSFTVTGLKTGSTSLAKYCLSATAEKDGIKLIAVVMAAPDYKIRFSQAQTMLNYGYANCALYQDDDAKRQALPPVCVVNGQEDSVEVAYEKEFSYLSTTGENLGQVERSLQLEEQLEAPVSMGQYAGKLVYTLDGREIGSVDILTAGEVQAANYKDYLGKLFDAFVLKGGRTAPDKEQGQDGETGAAGQSGGGRSAAETETGTGENRTEAAEEGTTAAGEPVSGELPAAGEPAVEPAA